MERGQFNWSDNVDYHKYLRRFAATHASDAEKIAGLLTQGRREDAAALVHGLKGVAGIMALTTVWRDADSVERALAQGKDSGLQVRDLQRALQVALSAIAIDTEPEKAATGEVVPGEVSDVHSLDELLRALDRDNPDEAEPILDGLAGRLPPDRLAALRDRLEAFDFRGAETVARAFVARSVVDPVEPPR